MCLVAIVLMWFVWCHQSSIWQKWECKPDQLSSCKPHSSHGQHFLIELLFNSWHISLQMRAIYEQTQPLFSSLILQNMHITLMQNRWIGKIASRYSFFISHIKYYLLFQRVLNLKESDALGIVLPCFINQISTLTNLESHLLQSLSSL